MDSEKSSPTGNSATSDPRSGTPTPDSNHRTGEQSCERVAVIEALDGFDAVPENGDESTASNDPNVRAQGDINTPASVEGIMEDGDFLEWQKRTPKKININWCNFETFKNRFSRDEGFDIIEVLAGHTDHLAKEITMERAKRRRKNPARAKHTSEGDSKFIHRVRIQSPSILHLLSRLTAQDDWNIEESRTFLRPFQTFYYSLPLVNQALDIMERRHNERNGNTDKAVTETLATSKVNSISRAQTFDQTQVDADPLQRMSLPSDLDVEEIASGISDIATAVQHIRLYVRFVEDHIVPMWKEAAGTTKQKVRFTDLPMYYRPGDVLFEPQNIDDGSEKAKSGSTSTHVFQNFWKLCFTTVQEWEADPPNDNGQDIKKQSFILSSYHIDWDGERYGPADSRSTINGYEGEKDIRSFFLYPLRYATEATKMREDLQRRSAKFISFVEKKHLYYDGWTLIHHTYSADVDKDERRQNVEHIEGEIMIDFKEGFQSDAEFVKPDLGTPAEPRGFSSSGRDYNLEIKCYSDSARTQLLGELIETIQTSERFDVLQSVKIRRQDKVLRVFEDNERVSEFESEHMLLFPQRLISYSFRARKFFVANVDSVSVISAPKNSFRDLRIDPEHKRILKSLVGTHFQKQHIRRQNKDTNLDQDFIRGKGSGLVILLHGVPGVGKTTTAEAVAMNSRKPLYTLTTGDLGSTPRDVEKALRETFRLATLWDCVLLLDEADLFLAKRDVGDMERNSLVSVFLRVLDYYDGVLFLTTNRVGTVDEAFRSRIHLTLYYPPLRRQQAIEIFQVNLRRLKEIEKAKEHLINNQTGGDENSKIVPIEIDEQDILRFAEEHWEITPRNRRWNGRQIRNAFQVAYSLVHFKRLNDSAPEWDEDDDNDWADDDEEDDDCEGDGPGPSADSQPAGMDTSTATARHRPAKLDRTQFYIVSQSIQRFDDYLEATRGKDSDRAKNLQVRRDDYHYHSEDDSIYDRSPRASRFVDERSLQRGQGRPPQGQVSLAPPPRGVSVRARSRQNDGYERAARPMGDRRGPDPAEDHDDDYVDEAPVDRRRRRGGVAVTPAQNRRRGYDDDYEY